MGTGALLFGPYAYYGAPYPGFVPTPMPSPELETQLPESAPIRSQVSIDGGRATGDDGRIERYSVDARLQTGSLLDFSTGATMLLEPFRDGSVDRLALWKGTVWLRIIEAESVEASLGVGYRSLFDRADSEAGGHVAASLRVFPLSPFVLSARGDAGRIGEAVHLDWRASAGVLLGPVEINLAWSGLQFDDVSLTGPTAGLRFWF